MSNEFVKQLIALLAQVGGSASIALADLQQLGIELTFDAIGSPDALLRLRLGPKIYYVPDKAKGAEEAWPTTETTPAQQSKLDEEISSINQLNNRPKRPRQVNPEEQQLSPASPAPSSPSQPLSKARVVPKTELDLFLREQTVLKQKKLAKERKDQQVRRAGREFPWETRKEPPPKLQ